MTSATIKFVRRCIENGHITEIPLVNLFKSYDGYPEGTGKDLAEWLLNKTIIDGIGLDQGTDMYANGDGCLVAQYIANNKYGPGGLYVTDMEDSDAVYNYKVIIDETKDLPNEGTPANDLVTIEISDGDKFRFTGSPLELVEMIRVW